MSPQSFQPFRIDRAARRLEVDGRPVQIGSRAFDVLAVLEENADRVVSKQQLLDAVWDGLVVEEGNLTVQISTLRKILGAQAIATVPGTGYKLVPAPGVVESHDGPGLPEKPSLAVLPFTNLTGDTTQEYLVDGLVSDLTAGLARVPGLFVIAATSSFKYKGKAVDLAEVGRQLGVRYVLEGSILRAGERLRIPVQLVEASSSHAIWSERFEGAVSEVFELQDRITEQTAAAIEPNLIYEEARRTERAPTDSLQAYDLCLRAAPMILRVSTRGDFEAATVLIDRALALDPDYAYAKALKVRAHVMAVGARAISHGEGRKALPLAKSLLDGGNNDPLVLAFAAHMVAYLGGETEHGYRTLLRAHDLNPNSVLVLVSLGWVAVYAGRYEAAIEWFERAYRINPLDPNLGHCRSGHGYALVGLGRDEEAVSLLETAIAEDPGFGTTLQMLSVVYELVGRHEEACEVATRYIAHIPTATVAYYRETTPMKDPALIEKVAGAMLAAGFPEA